MKAQTGWGERVAERDGGARPYPAVLIESNRWRGLSFAPGGGAVAVIFAAALGAASYLGWPSEPPARVVLVIAGLMAVATTIAQMRAAPQPVRLALMASCAFTLGFAWCQTHTHLNTAPRIERPTEVWVTGWVEQIDPANPERPQRYTIRVTELAGADANLVRVRVTPRNADPPAFDPELGQSVQVRALLLPPPGPAVPGGYDFARAAHFEQLGGVGRALDPIQPAQPAAVRPGFAVSIARIRDDMARAVFTAGCRGAARLSTRADTVCDPRRRIVAIEDPALMRYRAAGALVATVVTGDRSRMPPEAAEALRVSGLGHILAISGLHMALAAGGCFAVFSWALAAIPAFARGRDVRRHAALAALGVATAYLLVSGAGVATQRAYVMALAVFAAVIVRRRALSLRVVAVAGAVVLALAPQSAAAPGFQMSFAATIVLIGAHQARAQRRRAQHIPRAAPDVVERGRSFLADLTWTSLLAGAATAPFAAYHFHRVAAYGLVANILAMPVFSLLVMPMAVVSGALAAIGAPWGWDLLAAAPAALAGWGAHIILGVAQSTANMPGAYGVAPAGAPMALASVAAGLVAVAVLQRGRWTMALAFWSLAALAWIATPKPDLWLGADGDLVVLAPSGDALAIADPPYRGDYRRATVLRRAGRGGISVEQVARLDAAFACDALGCQGWAGGIRVAAPKDQRALTDDCARADLVVLRGPLYPMGRGWSAARQRRRTLAHASSVCRQAQILAPDPDSPLAVYITAPQSVMVQRASPSGRPWSPH